MSEEKKPKQAAKDQAASVSDNAQPTLKWDDSSMATAYANVANVSVTREECCLFFGTNLTSGISARGEVTIKLSDRIIMTPHAAKRLSLLLSANLAAYEERYGKLDVQQQRAEAPVSPAS